MAQRDAVPATKKTRVKLVYPAQQFETVENPRPDGALGLLYVAGALRDHGFDVSLLDVCVGDEEDDLQDTFYRRVWIDDTHVRVGMSVERMLEKLEGYDIVGVTSTFTPQTLHCFEVAEAVKAHRPGTLTVAGGGNARALHTMFLDNGFDVVVFGEGEETIVELAECVERGVGFDHVAGIAYKKDGEYVVTPERPVLGDLDRLPFPAWDLLPLQKYWTIGEPHGGTWEPGQEVRYLSMQTSRGCPFRCTYCHISKEGDAARLRFKSHVRVMAEIDRIKELGTQYLMFEDDSILAKKERIKAIFSSLKDRGLKLIGSNGVNLAHLFTRGVKGGPLVVDTELLDLMVDVGWIEIAYPFESGSQRILDKYATGKWNREKHDVVQLVRETVKRGLKVYGFITMGYPDETYDELTESFLFAKELIGAGLNSIAFYLIVPYPGSTLYDYAVANNHLPATLDLPNMKFALPTMVNTLISPEVLKYTRRMMFQVLNKKRHVAIRRDKNVDMTPRGTAEERSLTAIGGRDLSLGMGTKPFVPAAAARHQATVAPLTLHKAS